MLLDMHSKEYLDVWELQHELEIHHCGCSFGNHSYNFGRDVKDLDMESNMGGDYVNLERAIKYLVDYNGYSEIVQSLLRHIYKFSKNEFITSPDWLKYGNEIETVEAIMWFLLVCMFGEYGTSPRFGWIEKRNEAIAFLNSLLQDEVSE